MAEATRDSKHFLEDIRKYNCCFQIKFFEVTYIVTYDILALPNGVTRAKNLFTASLLMLCMQPITNAK